MILFAAGLLCLSDKLSEKLNKKIDLLFSALEK